MIDPGQKRRFAAIIAVLLLAWCGLGYRLATLHLGRCGPSRERLEGARSETRDIAGKRGRIFDRNGSENILALDLAVKDIIADPLKIATNNRVRVTAAALAPILGMSMAEIEARLNQPSRRYERLRRFADDETVRRVGALGIKEISFADTMVRRYPQNSLMCHVVGFANFEGVGGGGVEQRMNAYMLSRPGRIATRLDVARNELRERRWEDRAPVDGADVTLTLDQHLQYFVEKALDAAVARHRAKAAWCIVQAVHTGEILAMASRPGFNINDFRSATDDQKLNRAIGSVYEPGSTMKALTMSAVISEKLAKPSDIVFCENGAWPHMGRVLHDTHCYGDLTVADVIKKSSNIGTAKLALLLGPKRLSSYLRAFGIGSRTGLDLPGEESGILDPVGKWSGLSCSRIAIGQGVAVTAVQMLDAYCTIANDGVRMRPYVVSRVVAPGGAVLFEQKPQVLGRPISAETARTMKRLLARVTEDGGTGVKARVDGYAVAGKTGSAQKPVAGGYSTKDYVASFVGFLPAERPEIAIIVVVDEPQPCHVGGLVAAPVFGEIAAQSVRYLDVVPPGREMPVVASMQQ